jgi:murein DD-endopeptidase MepM/ murein hydrolase activator NlpD
MNPAAFLMAGLMLIGRPASGSASEVLSLQTSRGTRVDITAAAFAPGEIVVARLQADDAARQVAVHFGSETIRLGPASSGLEPFGLAGLDLSVKPGPLAISMTVLYADGTTESAQSSVEVTAREFPEKKLRVDEKYVTPPPEVEERIRWEAELLRTIYGVVSERWLAAGPFSLPHDGKLTPNFGERRVYNGVPRSTHAGVDIAAPYGSPVRASNAGRVVLARNLYFSGRTVIIDHGLGLFTAYCHFSRLMVKRGDVVRRGDVVGLAGSTGRSTGPHLHWAARVRESRVDPCALLSLPL